MPDTITFFSICKKLIVPNTQCTFDKTQDYVDLGCQIIVVPEATVCLITIRLFLLQKTDFSNKAMHIVKCKYCQVAVSQICSCNVEDPDSDNPMHRVHKSRDLCAPSPEKSCPKCGKKAKTEAILKCHMETSHPKYNCADCDSKFNNLEDFNNHKDLHLELRPRKKQRINLIENEDNWDVDP